ncbi:MAG TPA: lipid II flippase MurJ, partial [Candidatus Omnitrophota bacterium]|nr:lipid II flippase MurJ [Candidatus Omnitrophota bacterium]
MKLSFKGSKITPIKKATLVISVILLVVKLVNFFIDLLVAQYFGINENVDIYLYALMIPLLFNAVLANSFNQYFIPNYLKVKARENEEYKKDYLLIVFVCYAILVLIVSLICCNILPKFLIRINPTLFHSGDLIESYLRFSLWLGIYFFFFTVSNVFTSILQAEHYYSASLYPQIYIPLIGVISMLIFHHQLGIFSIIYGFVLGSIISFMLLFLKTVQKKIFSLKQLRFNFHILKTGTDYHQFLYLLIALIFPNVLSFIDKQMASYLGAGKLSALSYGQGIPNALSSILIYSLGISVFSYFSEWFVKDNVTKLIHAVRKAIYFLLIIIIPFCYYIFLFSEDIIGVLFERGNFTGSDTIIVSQIMQFYIFSIFLTATTTIATRIVSAIHKNHFFIIFYPSIFILKLLLNAMFVP